MPDSKRSPENINPDGEMRAFDVGIEIGRADEQARIIAIINLYFGSMSPTAKTLRAMIRHSKEKS